MNLKKILLVIPLLASLLLSPSLAPAQSNDWNTDQGIDITQSPVRFNGNLEARYDKVLERGEYDLSFWAKCDRFSTAIVVANGASATFNLDSSYYRSALSFVVTDTKNIKIYFVSQGTCFVSDTRITLTNLSTIPTEAPTSTPTSAPTNTPTQTNTPEPTSTNTPTFTPTPTPTNTPTQTPTPTSVNTSTSTPIKAATPTALPTNTPSSSGCIVDDTFSAGISPWLVNKQGAVAGTSEWDSNGSARLVITTSSSSQFHYQFERFGITIVSGQQYQIIFSAKASTDRTLGLKIQQSNTPFNTYFGESTYSLTNNYQTFTETFTAPTSGDTKYSFRAGLTVGTVWIDNVKLCRISVASTATPVTPSSTITPGGTVTSSFGFLPTGWRNKLELPFASDSPANTAIGGNAEYYPAGITYRCEGYCTEFGSDPDIIILTDTKNIPLRPVYPFVGFGWGAGTNRCQVESNNAINSLPLSDSWIIPDNGQNNSTSILMPNGVDIKQTQPIAHCQGSPWTSKYNFDTISIYGNSVLGPHGGSHLSGAPFAIKRGEWDLIRHPMGINLNARSYYNSNCSYSWPAKAVDGYCAGTYGGTNPYLRPGALLALLPTFDVSSLRTEPGRILARGFIDWGGYVGDDTSWNFWAIWTAQDDNGSADKEFQKKFGIPFRQSSNSPFMLDVRDIFTNLYIIKNNGPLSIGGGGTPRIPTYPPIGN